jgi:hypothetical protein
MSYIEIAKKVTDKGSVLTIAHFEGGSVPVVCNVASCGPRATISRAKPLLDGLKGKWRRVQCLHFVPETFPSRLT